MSKADKMFEELGLKRREKEYFEDWVTYYSKQKTFDTTNRYAERFVTFDTTNRYAERFVTFDTTYRYAETNGIITHKLHLAIHEKMKELGWLDE